MTAPTESTLTSLDALAALDAALDRVIAATADPLTGLAADSHETQTLFLQGFEAIRNRMALVDNHILSAADRTGLADHHHKRTSGDVLRDLLNLDPQAAQARVRAEKCATEHETMTGETIPARFPHIAAVQQSGTATPVQVDRLTKEMLRLSKVATLSEDQLDTAERILAAHASLMGPTQLGQLAGQIRERIDPDGDTPDADWHEATRRANWGVNDDGSLWLNGRFTAKAGSAITAVLDGLSRRNNTPETPDTRSAEQRRHDAMATVFARTLNTGDELPATGGTPATVIITMTEEQAESGRGTVRLSDGKTMSVPAAFRLADQADVITVLFSPRGAILDLGRKCRIASQNQTWALYVRDRGCSFPGCTVPAKWTQRHHVTPWQHGGLTNINNLTLLCHFHHHNFERLGWACQMRGGLPWWIPPADKDPSRTPRLHQRLHPGSNLNPVDLKTPDLLPRQRI